MKSLHNFLVNNHVNKVPNFDLITTNDINTIKENSFIKFQYTDKAEHYIIVKVKEYKQGQYLKGYYTITYYNDSADTDGEMSIGNGWSGVDPFNTHLSLCEFTDNDIKAIEQAEKLFNDRLKKGTRFVI